jgi:membrane protease YdiL (CAAX protease family)
LSAFLVLALGIGWVALGVPVALDVDASPFLLLMLIGLLGSALLVTWAVDGSSGVRRLFARAFQWRFSLVRWAVVLFAMPVLTLALAAATGTMVDPPGGWSAMAGWYLFNTLIFGALLANLWEETAWAGFVQTRLMARHGLLVSSLLTAVPFALIHVPLYLADAATASELARNLALLFALAPIYRYLLGVHLLDTGGSVLAVGIQHAAWNASGNLEAVEGEWQVIVAVVVLTVLVGLQHFLGRTRTSGGRAPERAAASEWLVGSPGRRETAPR